MFVYLHLGEQHHYHGCFAVYLSQVAEPPFYPLNSQESEVHANNQLPGPPTVDEECESMDSNNSVDTEVAVQKPEASQDTYLMQEASQTTYPVMYPAFFAPVLSYSFPFWPGYNAEATEKRAHEVVKPTPVHSKAPINVDELLGISRLSIGESNVDTPSPLQQNLLGDSNRQSAFHAKPPLSGSTMKSSTSPVQAV